MTAEQIVGLMDALAKIMPISIGMTPDYAEVYFSDGSGQHSTQAMTMNPQDWLDIQAAYEAILSQQQETKL